MFNESANISKRTSGKTGVKAGRVGHCSSSSKVSNTHISCSSTKRMSEFHSCRLHRALGVFSGPSLPALPQREATSPPSVPIAPNLFSWTTQAHRNSTGCLSSSPVHSHPTLLAASGFRQHTLFKDTSHHGRVARLVGATSCAPEG